MGRRQESRTYIVLKILPIKKVLEGRGHTGNSWEKLKQKM